MWISARRKCRQGIFLEAESSTDRNDTTKWYRVRLLESSETSLSLAPTTFPGRVGFITSMSRYVGRQTRLLCIDVGEVLMMEFSVMNTVIFVKLAIDYV